MKRTSYPSVPPSNGSCPFLLMEPFIVDVMPDGALDPYDWTLLRHVNKALHVLIPPVINTECTQKWIVSALRCSATPVSLAEALFILCTPEALDEYEQHRGQNSVTLMGMFITFMQRPRTIHDYNDLTRRQFGSYMRFTAWDPFLGWAMYNLKEATGFQIWFKDMSFAVTAFVRNHIIHIVCSGTPVFRAYAQSLLTDDDDLGTTQWVACLATDNLFIMEPLVRFNPKLAHLLSRFNEPDAAALFIELGGKMELTDLIYSTRTGDHVWLQVYITQRRSDVQECIDACREDHEDMERPFEDTLPCAVLQMLTDAGLL